MSYLQTIIVPILFEVFGFSGWVTSLCMCTYIYIMYIHVYIYIPALATHRPPNHPLPCGGGMWEVCGMYLGKYMCMYECIHACMYEGRYVRR